MRIGLYGLPCSGKNYLLDKIDFMNVKYGSRIMLENNPDFYTKSLDEKNTIRTNLAKMLKEYDNFIMDGHYCFGEEVAFTEADGNLYDVFIYLYVPSGILEERMKLSQKNQKYLKYDLDRWQSKEINSLRKYCHMNNKDFYILDGPDSNGIINREIALEFIKDIYFGFSCVEFARRIVTLLNIENKTIHLLDGDKTFCKEDTSRKCFNYKTNIFDNNFYSGFQSWRAHKDFERFNENIIDISKLNIRERLLNIDYKIIITSGYPKVWKSICNKTKIPLIFGKEISADTKYFITKFLKEKNIIVAYGDSMVDYYMVKEAHKGYLFTNDEGNLSSSLRDMDLGGIEIVSD